MGEKAFVGQVVPVSGGDRYRVTHVWKGQGTPPPGRPHAFQWVEFDVLAEDGRVVDHMTCSLSSWIRLTEGGGLSRG